MRAAVAVAILLLAGCTTGQEVTVSITSDEPTTERAMATGQCGQDAELDVGVGHVDAGAFKVRVLDGGQSAVFEQTYEQGDRGSNTHGLFGAEGTWQLQAIGMPGTGHIHARLTC